MPSRRLFARDNPQLVPHGQSKEAAAIVSRLVNACWSVFKFAVGLALVGVVTIGLYMYVRMDDEIRRHVEAFLGERYPHLEVSIGGARLVEGRGIIVYDVELAPRGDRRPHDELLIVDELLVVCDVEITTLVRGVPPIQRVEVKNPHLWLRRSAEGVWNFDQLLPRHPGGMPVPPIVIRGGEATLTSEFAPDSQPIILRDVDLTISPTAPAAAPGGWPSLKIEATAVGPQLKQLELHGTLDGPQQLVTAAATMQGIQLDEQLVAWIRPALPAVVAGTRLSGVVDGTINVTWQRGVAAAPAGGATFALRNGRVEDPRLPRPITELAARIKLDAAGIKVEDLTGKWGPSTLGLALTRQGWAPNAGMAVAARIDNVPLDDELYRTLAMAGNPQAGAGLKLANVLREEWDKYSPRGIVDATLQASFDGAKWSPVATLVGRELSFESDKFAYRLTGGAGSLTFKAGAPPQPPMLDVNLYGLAGEQRVNIVAQVVDPKPGAAGWAQISGENLEVDERLIAAVDQRIEIACNGKARAVLASIHPAGKFNLDYWRIDRPQPFAEPRITTQLTVTDGRVNYDGFPYPLQKISGVITAEGNRWTFANFQSGGRRTIAAHGHLMPTQPGGPHELWLHFEGQHVPLDEGLFWAVPEAVRNGWKMLQPNGSINVKADVKQLLGLGAPAFGVVVEPQPGATLRPQFFPYFMEEVQGVITYFDGKITVERLTARHQDGVTLGANGRGSFNGDHGWEFVLSGLWADGIKVRPALMTALPEKLRRLIDSLRPSGTFGLHGSELAFRQPASAIAPLETTWDLQLECHQTDLHCGIDVEGVTGSVRLVGSSNQQQSSSAGELNLESVAYQGIQLTNVKGPMWVDESECRFGKWAAEKTNQPERSLSGAVYGGAMLSDGWVQFAHTPLYAAEISVAGADLNRLMVERFGGRQSFKGKIDGSVRLKGEGPSLARLTGDGNVHIREADIYELPLLVSLLKILRYGAPDSKAFDESNIEFLINGPHIALNRIDFLGDVVDLYGYGETGFDEHVKLAFRAELGPREYAVPFVKKFVGQTSGNLMQLYVDGTLTEPKVATEAFPGFNQMIQQIRTDFEAGGGPVAREAARTDAFGRPLGR
ncbi:hypothetical protein [Lacipirellula limnantheis]|uniref:hypothetical protein n=1 Tax=Lacipirellula limnantheis TaxID=2528024 RepID=UPI0011A3AEB2|nr:hypothetical protein [Lacipirellula limnantheis]